MFAWSTAHSTAGIPIEADVEFCAVEGFYYAWKATGDDAWLAFERARAGRAWLLEGIGAIEVREVPPGTLNFKRYFM